MSKEFLQKKIEQIATLLRELHTLLERPFTSFTEDSVAVHAAERDFQLIIDLASDMNTHILVEREHPVPDTYRQSFRDLMRAGILPKYLADILVESAKLRNILVHEYDFEEDYERFYESAKKFLPAYTEYIRIIQIMINRMEK